MFFGVLHKRNATHLWNMLYFQGLFWILAATFTELPSVVCLLVAILRNVFHINSLCFVYQALTFKNVNGEAIQSMLEILLIGFGIPSTDAWNMVSNTQYFPFFMLRAFVLK